MKRQPPRPGSSGVRQGWRGRIGGPCLALLLSTAAAAQDGTRIGYVDMQRLLERAPQVIDARARLTREFAARDQRLGGDQQRLAELETQQRRIGSDSEAARLIDTEINALRRSVERSQQRLREELRSRTEEEIDRAFPKISDAVAEYARAQGYDLVLSSPVVYASGRVDITDAVLDQLQNDFQAERR
jgi:outer membrane protein